MIVIFAVVVPASTPTVSWTSDLEVPAVSVAPQHAVDAPVLKVTVAELPSSLPETEQPAGTELSLTVLVVTFVLLPSSLAAELKHAAAVSTLCSHTCGSLVAPHLKTWATVVFSNLDAPPFTSLAMRSVSGHSSKPL